MLVEIRSYRAQAARQAVAVDRDFFYAIDNRSIEKYSRSGGKLVGRWDAAGTTPIVHLNSGVVVGDRLYAAHSNYPSVPMVSSIEIFDTLTLAHIASHDLGAVEGSVTWVDRHNDRWWVGVANYDGRGGAPGRGSAQTSVIEFDDRWARVRGYGFPPELIAWFGGRSNSGGSWKDGVLFVTGHSASAVYALRTSSAGSSVLQVVEKIAAPISGQGVAWDRQGEVRNLWGIRRSAREVVVLALP